MGLKYTHNDTDEQGADATDSLEMKSGSQSGSRFGLKGSEDLGNGLKVGFVLENGFDADTGSLGNDGRSSAVNPRPTSPAASANSRSVASVS